MANLKVEMGARACTMVGLDPITSFDDGSAESVVIANNYEPLVENELDMYDWRFVMVEKLLAAVQRDEVNMSDRWMSAYQVPADCLGVRALRTEAGIDVPFERMGDLILTARPNNLPVHLEYSRQLQEEAWPHWFRELITFRLATLLASGVREDAGLAQFWDNKAEQQRRVARHRDSMQRSTRKIRQSDLVQTRSSRASNVDRYRRR